MLNRETIRSLSVNLRFQVSKLISMTSFYLVLMGYGTDLEMLKQPK